ncbi:bifunctional diaminohydroxyphosphoribosylaminopyrimidine deaminase/5-amino-6-(5-phosphoribosylamino)uracil reductase RibD [Prochlorothrix hollandica]|uniref:bifunctional diaminohydroxyphosphoribosylaminopyrimidine deaminase/5-amino-6-(5-phosphoribosylamino)uracil reductase RibD n=1 Tax=Prochlorothrix hollandica TaxID=1223 RepID=UPI003342AAFA
MVVDPGVISSGAGSPLDRAMMQRCLTLAQRAAGQTAPNPLVGSVVVAAGEVVGEGFHPGAGQPHAEVFALAAAGDRAQGATVYVNLEPCNHQGRTPPCTEALIRAGVATVVVGMIDPDPRVSGSGVDRLRQAGIEVVVGVEEPACQTLNEAFCYRVTQGRPWGIFKYAMTLDGKIATTTGQSAWITAPPARQAVHQLRSTCDAVIVGGTTVRRDNPQLTTHGLTAHNPRRVVMSRTLDLPWDAHLWDTAIAPTLVFTTPSANPPLQDHLRSGGVEVVTLETVTPGAVMGQLYDRGALSVLWECGGTLGAAAIAAGAVQKLWAFVAPKLIGGVTAPGPVGDLGLTHMDQAVGLERISWTSIGPDLLMQGYVSGSMGQ